MVLGQITTVLHGPPVLPSLLRLIDGSGPDLLAPDDILEVQGTAVLHNPLSNLLARESSILFLSAKE